MGDELTEDALRLGDGTVDIRSPGGTEYLYPAGHARMLDSKDRLSDKGPPV